MKPRPRAAPEAPAGRASVAAAGGHTGRRFLSHGLRRRAQEGAGRAHHGRLRPLALQPLERATEPVEGRGVHVWDVDEVGAFVARFKARYEVPLREIFE